MTETILLMTKKITTKEGKKFDTFYAYRTTLDNNGVRVKRLSAKNGKPISLKVNLVEGAQNRLLADINQKKYTFPVYMTLDDTIKINGNDSFFLTMDKDIDKKPRLDKYGKKHLVLVVREWKSIEEAPTTSYSFDDLEEDL